MITSPCCLQLCILLVCQKDFLRYLSIDDSCVLEQEPLRRTALDGELMAYKHHGFWQCMDTLREREKLEELWHLGAPWKVWEDAPLFTPAVKETLGSCVHKVVKRKEAM